MKSNYKISEILDLPFNELVFLCGAGISVSAPSMLPSVNNFIFTTLQECKADEEAVRKVNDRISHMNVRFEGLIDEIRKYSDATLKIGDIFASKSYNKVHSFLSYAIKQGANVITTNFDNCIENSDLEWFTANTVNKRIIYKGDDLELTIDNITGTLLKVHGSHPLLNKDKQELVITLTSLAKTNDGFFFLPHWRQTLLDILKGKVLIVMGYSCSDDFDIVPLLEVAKVRKIIWLNYDVSDPIPKQSNEIQNQNVLRLKKFHDLDYFNGLLIPLLSIWGERLGFSLKEGESKNNYTIHQYITENYPTIYDKQILINHILYTYSIYEKIKFYDENALTMRQAIKALYRLQAYTEVVDLCNERIIQSNEEDFEIMYYLSSALYFTREFDKSIDLAKKCVDGLEKSNDYIFYLNALANYASILSGTISQSDLKDENIINKAIDIYKFLQKRSKGLNIELEATAYWGLGYVEELQGNFLESKIDYSKAMQIFSKIGDEFNVQRIQANLDAIAKKIV